MKKSYIAEIKFFFKDFNFLETFKRPLIFYNTFKECLLKFEV